MESIRVKDIFAAVQDGKLRAFRDGPGVWIEDTETNEAVCLAAGEKAELRQYHENRLKRMFGGMERRNTANTDDGQGPYKGFLLLVCEECGKVKAFCAKRETYSFKCECEHETPLENLRPVFMRCKCGKVFRYKTNMTKEMFTHNCLSCHAPVDLELNKRGTAYVTVGARR